MSDVYGQPISGPQAPQGRSFWDIASQTWPAQMAQSMWRGATMPGNSDPQLMSDMYGGATATPSYPQSLHDPVAGTLANVVRNVARIPQRAFSASENYRQGGDYDPGPILEAATLPMGTGAIAGLPMRAGESALGAGFIRAYHGSPYDFDKFDLSKIGTGEGAQAYGHGLYFAENPNVAASYKNLAPPPSAPMTPEVMQALKSVDRLGFGSSAQAIDAIRTHPDWMSRWDVDPNRSAAEANAVSSIQKYIADNPRGRMYEVNINADPQQFLDWDKPLSQQPGVIPDSALMRSYKPSELGAVQSLSGSSVYKRLSLTGPQGASSALNEAGVPGIKYLDQGSRAAGDGSRNYVVFNPQIIDILKKYGIAGLGLTGAGLGALPAPHIQSQ